MPSQKKSDPCLCFYTQLPGSAWRFLFLFITILSVKVQAANMTAVFLPQNLDEATVMLRDGTLDSLEWDILRPYYIQPLNVALGELSQLATISDVSVSTFPSPEQLKKYEPWQPQDISRFFEDFPEFILYKPMLIFEKTAVKNPQTVHSALYMSDMQNSYATTGFIVKPVQSIEASGNIVYHDSVMVWRNREVMYHLKPYKITAGNFAVYDMNDLFYGYFPRSDSVQTTGDNWLYGQMSTWNGLLTHVDIGDKSSVTAFFHERATERIIDATCIVHLLRSVSAEIGASESKMKMFADSVNDYVHARCETRFCGIDATLMTGICTRDPLAVPVSVQIKKHDNGFSYDVRLAHIPSGADVPFSKLAYFCRHSFDTGDTLTGDISVARCISRCDIYPDVKIGCDIAVVRYGRNTAFQALVSATGTGYHVSYVCNSENLHPAESHCVRVVLHKKIFPILTGNMTLRYVNKSTGLQSIYSRVSADLHVSESVELSPFVSASGDSYSRKSIGTGLKQSLHIAHKTSCDGTVETSFDEHAKQVWEVTVRVNFSF